MTSKPHISVVTPVYGCCTSLPELYRRLDAAISTISPQYEIIMVNDASPDNAWETIQKLAEQDPRVKGIDLSRNFGQHYAITAGLDFANGDWIVVMDCDLQDVPEEIPKLYRAAQKGHDLVVGRRTNRQDSWFKKLASRLFYAIFAYFSDAKVHTSIGNFGIYSSNVIRSVRLMKEQNRSFGLFALWVGYRRAEIDIDHAARACGASSYTFIRALRLALDAIFAHSDKLLRMTVKLGLSFSLLSILYAGWLVFRYLLWGTPIIGWTSLIVSLYFTTGLVIGSIGIVGLYVGKIFDEVKCRPLYIISATTFEMINNDR